MLTFLKILFLGSWVTLTSEPVDIGPEALKLELDTPISAITPGANIRIDISAYLKQGDISSRLKEAKEFMPQGCLLAQLTDSDGGIHLLDVVSGSADKKTMHLVLSKREGLSTNIDFNEVSITSCKSIQNITVVWANSKK
jgi:hypothetical protein